MITELENSTLYDFRYFIHFVRQCPVRKKIELSMEPFKVGLNKEYTILL